MPERMFIGGVKLDLPYWGRIAPRVIPPPVSRPTQVERISTVFIPAVGPGPGPTSQNTEPGFLDHLDPIMGVAGFIIVGAMRLHPATAGAALFIGVGLAVINWGSEPVGAESSTIDGSHPAYENYRR